MEELAQQARAILAVYVERGRAALACLADGCDDDAAELLHARAAAFHNFRVMCARAEAAGWRPAADAAAKALWDESRQVDAELAPGLAAARERALELQQKFKEARRAIGNYRSGSVEAPAFAKTV